MLWAWTMVVAACSSDGGGAPSDVAGEADAREPPEVVRLSEYGIVRGIQLRLAAARPTDDELTVVLEASSGSLHEAQLDVGRSRISVDGGGPIEPSHGSGIVLLGPGDDARVEVTFPVDGRPDSFDLEVPRPYAVADDWEFTDVRLGDDPRPEVPDAVAIGIRRSHPQGTQIELGTLAFTESRIGVSIVVRNGGVNEIILVAGDDTYLEDDLGNRYLSVPPRADDPDLQIPGGSELVGVLAFAGAIAPGASTLSIGFNTGLGGSLERTRTVKPAFVIEDLPIDGTADTGPVVDLPGDLEPGETREHASGVSATLHRVAFEATTIRVSAEITNPNVHEVEIQPSISLVDSSITDDLGNEHELLAPDEPDAPPVISIPPQSTVETELAFGGRVDDDASSLRVALNEGTKGAATGSATRTPTFVWEELQIPERTTTDTEVDEDLIVPDRSELGSEQLDRSSAEIVARTVDELGGSRTPEGVLLVVPERVLFDFGSDVLRADSGEKIADIAGVINYFAEAPVSIVGHTDAVGSADSNQALSERRAAAVADALVDTGADRGRLSVTGRGEDEPAVPNTAADGSDDPDGRQQNRRVEVLIQTDQPVPEG